ncbi:MAG: hypothetical protein QOE71_3999 [Pseudonocardiales bacterium]|nr:hypothetical protein [Pseudonocardiales bacterium]
MRDVTRIRNSTTTTACTVTQPTVTQATVTCDELNVPAGS